MPIFQRIGFFCQTLFNRRCAAFWNRRQARPTGRSNVDAWQQNRCRWILDLAPEGTEASMAEPGNGSPEAPRWVYVCGHDPQGVLFGRYKRTLHRAAQDRAKSAAARCRRLGDAGRVSHPRRSCPRCNGWVYRIQRRFVDGLTNILSPVHRYRCRSGGCCWEGNLRVQHDALPHLGRAASNG